MAFQKGREFAHIHPAHDGSFHMTLPAEIAQEAYDKGWGEAHPKSGTPLIFGPRDMTELDDDDVYSNCLHRGRS